VPKQMGVEGALPGVVSSGEGEFIEFKERWTGACIFENVSERWGVFQEPRPRSRPILRPPASAGGAEEGGDADEEGKDDEGEPSRRAKAPQVDDLGEESHRGEGPEDEHEAFLTA